MTFLKWGAVSALALAAVNANAQNITESDDLVADEISEVTGEDQGVTPEIRMLRGESGFVPDSDSLQLQQDPHTGEFTFPNPDQGHESPATQEPESDEVISQLEAMIQETVELKDSDTPKE